MGSTRGTSRRPKSSKSLRHARQARASAAVCDGGSMIAQELEVSLHMAFVEARQAAARVHHGRASFAGLLDNPTAAEVLRACAANIDDLRQNLRNFIHDNTPTVPGTDDVDTQPTLGFQRVIQRAIMHVQSTVERQEGSDRRERAGRDLRREGFARRLLPAPAGRDASGRRQFHLARHHEDEQPATPRRRAASANAENRTKPPRRRKRRSTSSRRT